MKIETCSIGIIYREEHYLKHIFKDQIIDRNALKDTEKSVCTER